MVIEFEKILIFAQLDMFGANPASTGAINLQSVRHIFLPTGRSNPARDAFVQRAEPFWNCMELSGCRLRDGILLSSLKHSSVARRSGALLLAPYEEAFDALFATLDELEARLEMQRYLVGDRIAEADWRLFPTLVRFDAVYVGHFKCNKRRIADYPNLGNYLRDLYQQPGIADTVNMDHIKRHYYGSHLGINPTVIVPKGPALDLMRPHDRDRLDRLVGRRPAPPTYSAS